VSPRCHRAVVVDVRHRNIVWVRSLSSSEHSQFSYTITVLVHYLIMFVSPGTCLNSFAVVDSVVLRLRLSGALSIEINHLCLFMWLNFEALAVNQNHANQTHPVRTLWGQPKH